MISAFLGGFMLGGAVVMHVNGDPADRKWVVLWTLSSMMNALVVAFP